VHAEQPGLAQVGPQLGDVAAVPGPPGVVGVAVAGRDRRGALPDQLVVAGVGDESYYVGGGSYAKLGVRKGDRAFSITVTPGAEKATPDQVADLEKALAKDAVARL